jgi:hypothetical protein
MNPAIRAVHPVCWKLQVLSNVAYLLAAAVGAVMVTCMPVRDTRVRYVLAPTTVLLFVTGLVSTLHHRTKTTNQCSIHTKKMVADVDVVCACMTVFIVLVVIWPVTIAALKRSKSIAAPVALLVTATVVGLGGLGLYGKLMHTNETDSCTYDVQHAAWHVSGGMGVGLGYAACMLAMRP